MKKFYMLLLTILFCGLLCAPLYAQTAAELEGLLNTGAVNYGQAARFVLEAADVTGFSEPEQAFGFAMERQWLPKKAAPSQEIRLDEASLLIMKSFGIKGGLFYSIFKNPHYAYRELVYRSVIQGKTTPQKTVSGEQLVFLVNRTLFLLEDDPQ